MNLQRLLAGFLLLAPILGSCGAASTFPTSGPCPSATAEPTRFPGRPPAGDSEYRQALFAGIDQLTKLTADFKSRWPGNGFSRDTAFRTDFATYVDRSVCIAQGMLVQTPRAAADASFVEAFDSAVRAFTDGEVHARDGVKSRNVTVYRDWVANVDGLLNSIRETFRQFPQQPFSPTPRRTPAN